MTSTCAHAGPSDAAHAATCPDCGDAARALGRVERALASVHDDRRPPPGWKIRVLAAAGTPARRSWTWPWARIAGFAAPVAAAATVAVLAVGGSPAGQVGLSLAVGVEGHAGQRGSGNEPGVLVAHGAGGPPVRALRVYRGSEPILRCPGDAGCTIRGYRMTARVAADQVGRYAILYLAGSTEFATTSSLEDDLAAAVASGAEVVVKTVDVR